MKQFYFVCAFISTLCFSLLCNNIFAQQLKLSDLVVFVSSKNQEHPFHNDYGISVGASKITSGSIASGFSIQTSGAATILGNIHSESFVHLSYNNIIKGNISAAAYNCNEHYVFS